MPNAVVQINPESQQVRATGGIDDTGLIIAPLPSLGNRRVDVFTGETKPIQGWVSFLSGQKSAASTIRYRQTGQPSLQFCTVLYPFPAGKQVSVEVTPLTLQYESRNNSDIIGLQIALDSYIDYFVLDDTPERHKQFNSFTTDAQNLYIRTKNKDDLVKVIMRAGHILNHAGMPILTQDRSLDRFLFDYQA